MAAFNFQQFMFPQVRNILVDNTCVSTSVCSDDLSHHLKVKNWYSAL